MGFEITKKGQAKAVFKHEPTDMETLNWLGGDDLPANAYWPIPRDNEAPGEYVMKVTVSDKASKKSATLTRAFTVKKVELGYVRTVFTYPALALPALELPLPSPPVAVAGQTLMLHYALVGFEFNKDKKTDLTVTIRVLDEKGNATLKKVLTSDIKSDEKQAPGLMVFQPARIALNKAGKYKVELTAKDNLSKETTKEVFDLTVLEVK